MLADPAATRTARDQARQWAAPHLRSLRQRVAGAEQVVSGVAAEIADTEARLIELRHGVDATPPPPAYANAPRDPARGAPFYRLVDFASGVDGPARAGLEAALQASGLLAAWVGADGTIADPDLADVVAVAPEPGDPAGTLAELLVPAVEPDSPVSTDVVRALLTSVRIEPGAGLSVGPTGRWSAGVLRGALAKHDAEFVGAGAREAARARLIAELAARLETLGEQRTLAEHELDECVRAVAEWENHLETFPDDRAVISAHATTARRGDAGP